MQDQAALDAMLAKIQSEITNELQSAGISKTLSDPDLAFTSLGLTSLALSSLATRLSLLIGRELKPTLFFDYPSPLRLAQALIEERDVLQASSHESFDDVANSDFGEPIAVVGMACRVPGASHLQEFWTLLKNGICAVGDVPKDRWDSERYFDAKPRTPGKSYTKRGGFIEGQDLFDAEFFGISPREAIRMDPQSRIVLETIWQCLEDAGEPIEKTAGENVGVFLGMSSSDYSYLNCSDKESLDQYTGTGNAHSVASGRVSYFFDWKGPSVSLDTACSSSLVAIHQACLSLRTKESTSAIAAGVNLILNPDLHITFSQAMMLSPEGLCRTFDDKANGYVRGEGVGAVYLKRLSDAQKNGDRIYALIRGSAVNQDGKSNGITAPNGTAQKAVIEKALQQAKVAGNQVGYVEAHGTATPLGDPIEFGVLANIYGKTSGNRGQAACYVGSVKTNIGHLEAAAGIIGFIKASLSVCHGVIPKHLHFSTLNRQLESFKDELAIPAELTTWKHSPTGRIAGVSSFGFGGTNAHIILGEAPSQQSNPYALLERKDLFLFCLSSRSETSLRELAGKTASLMSACLQENPALVAQDFAYASLFKRSHLTERLALSFSTPQELFENLGEFAEGRRPTRMMRGSVGPVNRKKLAFLFTGQGSQRPGMGFDFYKRYPLIRDFMNECEQKLKPILNLGILDIMFNSSESNVQIHDTAFAQPALFIHEVALAKFWMSLGVRPQALLGHSVGEIAAAYVAGCLSLEDALSLVAKRGKLMASVSLEGAMATLWVPVAEIHLLLKDYAGKVCLAAENGPDLCVVSGDVHAIDKIVAFATEKGIRAKRLNVSKAFHSHHLDSVLEEFRENLSSVKFTAPQIPLVSNVTGNFYSSEELPTSDYWAKHARGTTHFRQGVQTLFNDGFETFLEVGPDATLIRLAQACAPVGKSFDFIASVSRTAVALDPLAETAGKLFCLRAGMDFSSYISLSSPHHVTLPPMPFQRKRYWKSEQMLEIVSNIKFDSKLGVLSNSTQKGDEAMSLVRKDEILRDVTGIVCSILQIEVSKIDVNASLLELGADSLLLMDAVRLIEDKYGVSLTVAQMFDGLSSISALTDYLVLNVPAPVEKSPQAAGVATLSVLQPSPGLNISPAQIQHVPVQSEAQNSTLPTEGWLGQVVSDQIRLMQAQLDFLKQGNTQGPSSTLGQAVGAPSPQRSEVSNAIASVPKAHETTPEVKDRFNAMMPERSSVKTKLPEKQQRHIDDLTEKYNARTRGSKEYAQKYRKVFADNRNASGFRPSSKELTYPIVATRSKGARLWDIDGNEYIDFTMGFGVNFFGHSDPEIMEAVEKQLHKGFQVGPQSELAGEVSRLFCELTGNERVVFTNSGTEAVMTAVRLVRAATGKSRIVIFTNSYHGTFDGVLARSKGGNPQGVPVAAGIPSSVVGDVTVLEFGSQSALDYLRKHAHEHAAVIVEPVQSRHPGYQPRDFIREVRQITERSGTAFIFDEVITGLRTGPGGAQEFYGVKADIATYGKVLGGGMPIGAVAGMSRFIDHIDGGWWQFGDNSFPPTELTFFAGTFCKHPLTMAAAHSVLTRLVANRGLQQSLNDKVTNLVGVVNAFFQQKNYPVELEQFGSLFRFAFQGNLDLLFIHLLMKKLYIWEGRNLFISTAHTDLDMQAFVNATKESTDALFEAGFINPRQEGAQKKTHKL
jgi:iturin family lipopeptide synthetase A